MSGHSCLVLDIRNEVLIFTIEHDASHGLSYIVFIMLRCVPHTPNLLKVFNHESMLYFVKCFFCLCEITACLKKKEKLILLMWCTTFIDFCVLNHSCIQGVNPTWSWFMSLLKCPFFGKFVFIFKLKKIIDIFDAQYYIIGYNRFIILKVILHL